MGAFRPNIEAPRGIVLSRDYDKAGVNLTRLRRGRREGAKSRHVNRHEAKGHIFILVLSTLPAKAGPECPVNLSTSSEADSPHFMVGCPVSILSRLN